MTGRVSVAQWTSGPDRRRRAIEPLSDAFQTGVMRASVTVTVPDAEPFPSASVARLGSRSRSVGLEQVPRYTDTAYVTDGRSPWSCAEKLPVPAQ